MIEGGHDLIEVTALRLRCLIGVSPEERRGPSDVVIDLAIAIPPPAGRGIDRLEDTWNYKPPVKAVIAHVEPSAFQTVEALAESIARLLVAGHGAPFVRVRVAKPGALRFADGVAVVIERAPTDFAPDVTTGAMAGSAPVPVPRREVVHATH